MKIRKIILAKISQLCKIMSSTVFQQQEAWNAAWNRSQPSNPSLWTTIDGFRREDGLVRQKWVEPGG